MKKFEDCNYYEMLGVSINAGLDDIKCAYRDALAIYDSESLATYSLFNDDQRADLLRRIEEAFNTLSARRKRAAYNQDLVNSGKASMQDFSIAGQKQLAGLCCGADGSNADNLCVWVKKKSVEEKNKEHKDRILAQQVISGSDLKAFRQALGVELSDIHAISKISTSVLQAIEKNQFKSLPAKFYLKRFLQSYAEILQIDPRHISVAYLKNMNCSGNS